MEDISLHILDIAENSINAGATLVRIKIIEKTSDDFLSVEIEDNGSGIPKEHLDEVLNPFYTTRTTRRVGLGLSLLAQSARETGGDVSIQSGKSGGTIVAAKFIPSHIDMKPLGSVSDTLLVLIAGNPEIDFVFIHERDGKRYSLDTRGIKADLDGVPINMPEILSRLREYLKKSLAAVT
jgi:hypothetical protein